MLYFFLSLSGDQRRGLWDLWRMQDRRVTTLKAENISSMGKKEKFLQFGGCVCKWTWAHVRLYTLRTRRLLWAIKINWHSLPLCGAGFCSLILSLSLSESNFLYRMLFSSLQPNGNVDIQQLWDHNFVFVSQRKLLLQCLRLCSKSCKNYELIKSKPLVTVWLKPGKM